MLFGLVVSYYLYALSQAFAIRAKQGISKSDNPVCSNINTAEVILMEQRHGF